MKQAYTALLLASFQSSKLLCAPSSFFCILLFSAMTAFAAPLEAFSRCTLIARSAGNPSGAPALAAPTFSLKGSKEELSGKFKSSLFKLKDDSFRFSVDPTVRGGNGQASLVLSGAAAAGPRKYADGAWCDSNIALVSLGILAPDSVSIGGRISSLSVPPSDPSDTAPFTRLNIQMGATPLFSLDVEEALKLVVNLRSTSGSPIWSAWIPQPIAAASSGPASNSPSPSTSIEADSLGVPGSAARTLLASLGVKIARGDVFFCSHLAQLISAIGGDATASEVTEQALASPDPSALLEAIRVAFDSLIGINDRYLSDCNTDARGMAADVPTGVPTPFLVTAGDCLRSLLLSGFDPPPSPLVSTLDALSGPDPGLPRALLRSPSPVGPLIPRLIPFGPGSPVSADGAVRSVCSMCSAV